MSMKDQKDVEVKRPTLTAIIFPGSGGPYEAEVEPDENQCIMVNDNAYKVTPNSTWVKNRKTYVICHESNPVTIAPSVLAGTQKFTPRMLNTVIKHNRLKQLFDLLNEKKWYQDATTWIQVGLVGLAVLVMVWGVISLDGGFEGIQESIQTMKINTGSASNQGHNRIGA